MHAAGRVNQYEIDRPKGFPHFQLLQCVQGSGILEVVNSVTLLGIKRKINV
jgi:hypothetical protein